MKKKDKVPVHLRLLPEIADSFRDHIRRRGDVEAFLLAAITETDLENIPLDELRLKFGERKGDHTVFKLPKALLTKVSAIASARKCSTNALLNGAIAGYAKALKLKSSPSAKQKHSPDK